VPALLHISDLHVGADEEPEVEGALRLLVETATPELIVATGDLTHRGRPAQHRRAAELLRGLGSPVLAVPGNHDIPLLPPARFTHPFREFEQRWETTEPLFRSAELAVVGLNSVRPWRHQSGGVRDAQLERTARLLGESPPDALRVVALHHHLTDAPWRSRKRPVSRRSHVLAALVDAGAELVLTGHVHQSALSERREFEVATGGESGVTVAIAPGLGRPRPQRHGEARGLHVYDSSESEIRAETYVWREGGWALTAVRRFPRGPGALAG
jgi:3',5'-cyclic AMP phosphodiesterase CpdA